MRLARLFGLILLLAGVPAAAYAAAEGGAIGSLSVPEITPPPPLDPHAPQTAWKGAAHVSLTWDVTHQRPGSEPSTADIATSGNQLFIRFDVKQREALLAQQHANNVGDGTDDEVWIDVWPDGAAGFFYQFAANSNGTHWQYSSENTAYAPTWQSAGATYDGGFTVTMKIPMRVMRGSHSDGQWRVQFVRVIRSTGEREIWSYAPVQTNGDDVTYSGIAHGLHGTVVSRPQPRIAPYALEAFGSPGAGLNTARMGSDISIPITATSSFYATLHPDFSNVEIDQATISPTAFQRVYAEVRPFFTQGANYYDAFDCDACPGIAQLYTPAIPTPHDGYAVEGRQGLVQFAAFNAQGDERSDAAQVLTLKTKNNQWRFTTQRVASDSPLWHDDVLTSGLSWNDNKHISAYFNYGSDAGSNVAIGNQAQRYDFGTFVYSNTAGAAFSARKAGFYYDPVDGYVAHPDIAGYAGFISKIWLFSPHSAFNSIGVSGFLDRYHNFTGALNQTDNNLLFDFLTKSRIDVQVSLGSSYVLENNCATAPGNLIDVNPVNYRFFVRCQVFTPVSQNGIGITWHAGTANSPGNFPNHGASSTPTSFSYNTGAFGPGRVDSWNRVTTMRVGMRGTFSLEADDTRQYLFDGQTNVQWLERAGYTYTLSSDESISFGVRRLIGTAPYLVTNEPATCITVETNYIGEPNCTGAWNLSMAFHKRTPKDEYYFAYGDASQLSTVPQWTLKWIHYIGAEKGT